MLSNMLIVFLALLVSVDVAVILAILLVQFSRKKNLKNKNNQIAQIEKKLFEIQKSTRVLIPSFQPWHERLRMKFKWYYNWHLKSYAKGTHWVILLGYLLVISLYFGPKYAILISSFTLSVIAFDMAYHLFWPKRACEESQILYKAKAISQRDIEKKLEQIQKSTRTTFPKMTPWHEKLRERFHWYYNWHLNPFSTRIHLASLAIYIVAISFGVIYGIWQHPSYPTRADFATYTWTGNGDGFSWTDASNWDVNSGYPSTYNHAVIINTGSASISAPSDESFTIGSLELGANYTGTVTLGNAMNICGIGGQSGALTITNANASVDLSGYTLSADAINNSGTIKVAGSETFSSANPMEGTGNVEYLATTGTTTLLDVQYYGLKINGSGGTYTIGAETTINGPFNLSAGTFTQGFNMNLIVLGDFTIANGATFTKGTNGGKLIVGGASTPNTLKDLNTTKQDLGALQVGASPGTTNLGSDITASSLTVPTSDIFNTMGYDLTITGAVSITGTLDTTDAGTSGYEGDGTILATAGDFTVNVGGTFTKCVQSAKRSLVKFNKGGGGTQNLTSRSQDMGDIQTSTSSSTTLLNLLDALTAQNITIDASTTLDPRPSSTDYNITAVDIAIAGTLDAGSSASVITVSGNWTATGTFTSGTSIVTFTSASTDKTITSGEQIFYSLAFNNSGGGWTAQDTIVCTNVTITAGTFNANGKAITISGNWENTGTFNHGNNTVNINPDSVSIISGNNNFYNLSSSSAGKTISFASSSTQNVTGILSLQGATSNNLILSRNGGSGSDQWIINPSGTRLVSNLTVSDSNNSNVLIIAPSTSSDGGNNSNWLFTNLSPNDPETLVQSKTNDDVLATGAWTNESSIKFNALVSDQNGSDTIYLCVEKKPLGQSFTNSEDACGSGVSYSGTPVPAYVTISSLTEAEQYHWQARVKDINGYYSNWITYGANNEADRDFGVDFTAPIGGSVNDGVGADIDVNNGSIVALSANWNFDSSVSGIQKYEYTVRRLYDGYYWNSTGTWQSGGIWYDNSNNTAVTVSSMDLQTNVTYYFNVKATDNAENVSGVVSSDGIVVLPTLSFSLNSTSVAFSNLNSSNNWTDTKTNTITTSTNAYGGYTIKAYASQLLRSIAYPTDTIANFVGTWASPLTWTSGLFGFGYTSNDPSVQGSNRFNNGNKYAGFTLAPPGNVIADHTDLVTGASGAVINEQFTVQYKISISITQPASTYTTDITYIATAIY